MPDDPRLLARSSTKGYTDFPGRALRSGPHGADIEPEAIPEELQREYSAEPRRRWEVVKADELARKASRSRCGRLKKVDQAAGRSFTRVGGDSMNALLHSRRTWVAAAIAIALAVAVVLIVVYSGGGGGGY